MFNQQTTKIYVVLVALATLWGSAARAANSTVLVVPSRHTIVQLAFDIQALRGTKLIAYDKNLDTDEIVLHAWDTGQQAWSRMTLDEYAIGAFAQGVPDEMILVGSDTDLPAVVMSGASLAKKVTRIDTLNLVTVMNTLHKSMKFKPSEWKIIAERHGLEIEDKNYERRRWGRYGPPNKDNTTEGQESEEAKDTMDVLEAELDAETVIPLEEKGLELAPEDAPETVVTPEADVTPEATVADAAEEVKGAAEASADVAEENTTVIVEELDAADK
jgi:hypothetical protein